MTVTATGRGPNNTYQIRKGFDFTDARSVRNIQLVSPILTQWLGATPPLQFETGGIAVLNFNITAEVVPEPGLLVGLVAGLSMLGVLYRRNC